MEEKRITMEAYWSENIKVFAQRMLDMAEKGFIVDTIFNGTPLTSKGMKTVDDIVKQKEQYQEKQYQKYINSPQYTIDRKKELEEKQAKEKLRKELIEEFSTLNLDSTTEIVNWLAKMVTCDSDIVFNLDVLLPTLENHGYSSLLDENINDHIILKHLKSSYIDQEFVENFLISKSIGAIKHWIYLEGDDHLVHLLDIYKKKFVKQINDNHKNLK